ncbi:glycoprotein 3-alpha-L-fucosyltransferase A-like [Culicoides brevitarsis]|uniref:glycoprotein 3-alpha-L-fucosyltransferase A-like n=1 Tax=Culicoides brevitarsis TaxID=469753 RepID=UPI00307BB7BD
MGVTERKTVELQQKVVKFQLRRKYLYFTFFVSIFMTCLYVTIPLPSESEIIVKCSKVKTVELYFFNERKNLTKDVDVTKLPLFPKEDPISDRIVNQLLYMPPNYENYAKNLSLEKYKKISIVEPERWGAFEKGFYKLGTEMFKSCPVFTCTVDNKDTSEADLVLFKTHKSEPKKHPNQLRLLFELEGPPFIQNTNYVTEIVGEYEWVSTYRHDSDIPVPYGKWMYFDDRVRQLEQTENFAAGKTKKIAWFVSNCHPYNKRMEIAKELRKYLPVDIFGKCSDQNQTCPRGESCDKMLESDYKFYLAFENADCGDYITEKTFKSLKYKVLPIVMGARPEEYRSLLPERSFVHVDDFDSVAHLGAYLQLLDQDDNLYNSYFAWRGTGENIDDYSTYYKLYWCRLCAMLHNPNRMDLSKTALYNTTIEEWFYRDCQNDGWKMNFNGTS